MRLEASGFYLCCLLLVTHPVEPRSLSEKPLILKQVEDTLKSVGEKIGDRVRQRLNSILEPPWIRSTTTTTTTTTTEEPQLSLDDIHSRNIITVPLRCPPNHGVVAGKCRKRI